MLVVELHLGHQLVLEQEKRHIINFYLLLSNLIDLDLRFAHYALAHIFIYQIRL